MCAMANAAFPHRRVHVPWPKSDSEPDADGGVIWLARNALNASAVPDPKRRLGVGKYWTVYASATDDWSVVKLRPLVDASHVKRVMDEERVYRLAAKHGVGPAVRDWSILRGLKQMPDQKPVHADAGWLSARGCEDRKVWGVAVAVVERYDESVADAKIESDADYKKHLVALVAKVEKMEDATGIYNTEPYQPRNVLVEWERPDCNKIARITVGDWGSFRRLK